MKVSVIIPTYNRCTTVQRAIMSILAQTHHDVEITVVDDGSTDDTEHYFTATPQDARVRYVRLPNNAGVHVARNEGLARATGVFTVLLDSDDELVADAIERAVTFTKGDPIIDAVYGAFRTDTGLPTGYIVKEDTVIPFKDVLCGIPHHPHKTGFVMIRTTIAKTCEFFAPNIDFTFYRYVAKKSRAILFSPGVFGVYHTDTGGGTLTRLRRVPNIARSIQRAQGLERYVLDFSSDFSTHCPRAVAYYAYGAAIGLLLAGERGRALVMAKRAHECRVKQAYTLLYLFVHVPFASVLLRLLFLLKRWCVALRK